MKKIWLFKIKRSTPEIPKDGHMVEHHHSGFVHRRQRKGTVPMMIES